MPNSVFQIGLHAMTARYDHRLCNWDNKAGPRVRQFIELIGKSDAAPEKNSDNRLGVGYTTNIRKKDRTAVTVRPKSREESPPGVD